MDAQIRGWPILVGEPVEPERAKTLGLYESLSPAYQDAVQAIILALHQQRIK